jgi:cysteinyl-tRNA synthetase
MLEKFPGELLRYYFIKHYYQRPMNFSMDKLEDAQKSLAKIHDFYRELKTYDPMPNNELSKQKLHEQEKILKTFEQDFFGAMDEDFNTAKAMGHLFVLINDIGAIIHTKKPLAENLKEKLLEHLESIDKFFNFIIPKKEDLKGHAKEWKSRFENLVDSILNYRKKLKKQKKYEISDAIREILEEEDIQVNDKGDDFTWELLNY